jgi:hypothetical protein
MRIKIYLNRDNVITFGLLQRRAPVDATAITRVVLLFEKKPNGTPIAIDSNTVPALFDFTTSEEFSGTLTGVLKLKLGAMAGVAVGFYKMSVVVYDPTNTNGINWAEMLARVVDDTT